jgi:hypothetical protein
MYTTNTSNNNQIQTSSTSSKKYFITERKSYYEFINTNKDQRPNVGFDYEGHIFEKSLSNITYNGDENRKSILDAIEKVMFNMIESVKRIRNFRNYLVPKNNKYVR